MTDTDSQYPPPLPLAIKRADGEPLTRGDLQYDLLQGIFEDQHAVFTDPFPTLGGEPAGSKVTFRDLYVNAIANSRKISKLLRDRIVNTPEFGTDFAMVSLLANVGRINTTMACEFQLFRSVGMRADRYLRTRLSSRSLMPLLSLSRDADR